MKRFFMILATVASVAVGCTKNGLEPITPEVKIGSYSLKAVFSEATKTSVDNEGKMAWVTGDKIAVYDGDFEEFTLKGEATGAEATFTGDIYYPEEACVAVCPFDIASEVADEILTVNLPFSYEYDGQSTHAPMIATGFSFTDKEATLKFKHIGGLFKVTYNNIPEEAKYFCFESETNQIAGEFYIEDYKAANTSIEVGPKPEDGNIVSYTISSTDDHSSMSFFVPVPVGTFDFNISLRDAENNKIAKSSKTKRGFTIARGDYVDIPAVNMPKTLTENFNSTACTTDASKKYGSTLAFSDANVKGFDFTWKAGTGSQNIFDGGIKLGAGSKAGDVTSSDILNDIAKGTNFTVLVYASGWASTPNLTVSYNNMDLTYALTQQIASPNEKTYSASDFVEPVEYVFQKADATDLKISVATSVRVIIDKIIIKEGGDLPEKTYSVTIANNIENGSVSANPSANVLPGTEVTLTATPATGYEFDSWNVTNASTSEAIALSEDNKFTMPAANVNVSATFNKKQTPTYASLEELVADNLTSGTEVTVSFENVPIKDIYVTNGGYRNGIFFDIQKGGKDIEIYYQNVPTAWVKGGTVSGTLTNCPWKLYNGTWELAPASGWSWSNLEYTAPVVLAAPTITTQPTSATYDLNVSSKNLTVAASGNPSPTYQWYSNTTNSNENGTILTGETNTSYKPSTNTVGTFYYYCVATNSEGSATSNVATITVNEPATANLPFSFDGGKNDIASTDGMSQTGLGSDYSSSPKLKFDSAGDNVIVNFNEAAKKVTYTIKGNGTSGTYAFDVMESADGIEYSTIHSHTSVTDEKSYTDNLSSSARFIKFVYTTKANGNVALGKINISNEEGGESEEPEEKEFNTTYEYGLSGWNLTNYIDQSTYYQVPSGNDPSVATIGDIFIDKTIKSDVVITINCATYGSGSNPSNNTFSIYKETECINAINATKGGTLPTSNTYTNVTYTVSLADAASFANDLAIKITKPGKTIRLKSIKVEFKYTE